MANWVIYGRVSRTKQDNENQLADLREFAQKQGWTLKHEYVDTIRGSGKKARLQFDAMMAAAFRKEFDGILFWKLDRFSREGVRKTLFYLSQLDGYKVAWRSYQEPWFDSCGPFKETVIAIMATLAEQERISISERTKAGLRSALRKGKKLGRPMANLDMHKVHKLREQGLSLRAIGNKLGWSAALIAKRLVGA
jgi:DNA invertase Pin-like site-specific DNA recombinase